MVDHQWRRYGAGSVLSVLALSSRFDGHIKQARQRACPFLSVLALSSRFDGRG